MTRALLAAVLALLLPPAVYAAQSDMEEVIVTGSYIKGSPEDAASPIDVITRAEIDIQSAVTIADITKNLTINSGSTTNTNFDTENDTITGKANVNLRNLGLNSTLVLINGKRQVVAAAESQDGSEFVDINTIPLVMLDRVEILKDGGSALYGSDAIAGVVNFILRDDFEGFQVAADLTQSERGSAQDKTLSAIWGHAFNDGKTNLTISAEYFERDPTGFNDLGLVDSQEQVTGTTSQITALIPGFNQINPAYVNGPLTAQAAAVGEGTRFTDPLCAPQGYSTGLFSERADLADHHCREDTQEWRVVQAAQDRFASMVSFTHAFDSGAEVYGLLQYNRQRIDRPTSGAFGAIDSLQAIYPVGDPIFGLGSRSDLVVGARNAAIAAGASPFDAAPFLSMQALAAVNPMLNAPITQANGGPNALASLGYQLSKRGVGEFDQKSESDTYGGQVGIRGDFDFRDRAMTYDVSFGYTKNTTYRENHTVNRTRLELAQNGLGGPNCTPNGRDDYDLSFQGDPFDPFAFLSPTNSGAFGGPVGFLFTNAAPGYVLNLRRTTSLALTSTNHGQDGCQFLNPFLTKETTLPNDQALLDYIYAIVPLEDRENTLAVFDAVLTSEMFEIGGGMVHGAIGYQFRDTSNSGESYDLVNPGLQDFASVQVGTTGDGNYGPNPSFIPVSDDHFYGQFTKDFDNDRTVHAFFGEMQLPITSDIDVQLAVRFENYGGDIGYATTPKIGVRWQATDDLVLRTSFSEAFRAPNTGPIFKGVGFDGQAATDSLASAEVRQGLVAPSPATDTVVALIQNGRESPNLGNEEAQTFNIGVIWNPTQLIEGVTLKADYYWFEFKDKVVNGPLSATLATELSNFNAAAADPANFIDQNTFTPCTRGDSGCIVNPNSYATLGVQRSPQGALQVVDFTSINAGEIITSGVDVGVSYLLDTDWGNWTFSMDWTHIIEYEPKGIPGFETGLVEGTFVDDAVGTTGDGSVVRTLPQDRANFVVNFLSGDHMATASLRYVSGFDNLGAQAFNSGLNPPKTVFDEKVDAASTLDLQYNYQWSWSGERNPLSMTLGIVNAFDSDPPDRNDLPQGYDSTVHDPRGRRYYLRLAQSL